MTEDVKNILYIEGPGCDESWIDVHPSGNVVMIDYKDSISKFSKSSAIAIARAILNHFGEDK